MSTELDTYAGLDSRPVPSSTAQPLELPRLETQSKPVRRNPLGMLTRLASGLLNTQPTAVEKPKIEQPKVHERPQRGFD